MAKAMVAKKQVLASVDVRKFTEYALDATNSKGKYAIFESLGYTKDNAAELVMMYKKQGLKSFLNKRYVLRTFNEYGQRITIIIKLKGIGSKTGKTVKIKSGWMIENHGIRLITPFAGFS